MPCCLVTALEDKLGAVVPDAASSLTANADRWVVAPSSRSWTANSTSGLASCERAEFITTHEAFNYLALRYGLPRSASPALNSDGRAVAPPHREIHEEAKAHGVTTIFFETLTPCRRRGHRRRPRPEDRRARPARGGDRELARDGLPFDHAREFLEALRASPMAASDLADAEGVYVLLDGMPDPPRRPRPGRPGRGRRAARGQRIRKSTLIRTLLGLIPHQEGDLPARPAARPVPRLAPRRLRAADQRHHCVANATVREIVSSGRLAHRHPFRWATAEDRAAMADALEQVFAGRAQWPKFAALGRAEAARVPIARALATRPT